jgi:hypothetical protein
LAEGRQTHFAEKLIASMKAVPEYPELIKVPIDTPELAEGLDPNFEHPKRNIQIRKPPHDGEAAPK